MENDKKIIKKISCIIKIKPPQRWIKTPLALVEKVKPFFEKHINYLFVESSKSGKNEDLMAYLFKEACYLKRTLEDLVSEGLVEEVAYFIDNIPKLSDLNKLIKFLGEKSVPKNENVALIKRGDNFFVYYKGDYFFKSWLTEKIYKIRTEDVPAIFPVFKKEIKEKKLFDFLEKKFEQILTQKNDLQILFYNFLRRFSESNTIIKKSLDFNLPYAEGVLSPSDYHLFIDNWTKNFLNNEEVNSIQDMFDYFKKEAVNNGLSETSGIKNYLDELNFFKGAEKSFYLLEKMCQYAKWISESNKCQTVYILRDTISIRETDFVNRLLDNDSRQSKVILMNRFMLACEGTEKCWWNFSSEVLYDALISGAKNYKEFFYFYFNFIKNKAEENSSFRDFLIRTAKYLIKERVFDENKKTIFIDTGIHGSVALFLCATSEFGKEIGIVPKDIEVDLRLYSVLFCFRDVYKGRYFDDNYSSVMLDFEHVSRQEHLYEYVPGTFEKFGVPMIKLNDKKNQLLANMELIYLIELVKKIKN